MGAPQSSWFPACIKLLTAALLCNEVGVQYLDGMNPDAAAVLCELRSGTPAAGVTYVGSIQPVTHGQQMWPLLCSKQMIKPCGCGIVQLLHTLGSLLWGFVGQASDWFAFCGLFTLCATCVMLSAPDMSVQARCCSCFVLCVLSAVHCPWHMCSY